MKFFRNRQFKFFFMPFLVIFIVASMALLYFSRNMEKFLWPTLIPGEWVKFDTGKSPDKQIRHVKIAGRSLDIPVAYLSGRLDKGEIQDAINISLVYPNFSSYFDFKSKQEYKTALNERHLGVLLIQEENSQPPLEISYNNLRRSVSKIEKLPDQYGLKKELWYREPHGKLTPYYEVFVETNNKNELVSYIFCDIHAEKISQGCGHDFINKGIKYHLYYSKINYLHEWKTMQESTIKFIDNFDVNKAH